MRLLLTYLIHITDMFNQYQRLWFYYYKAVKL
jgi:hypothetical protein